jgi:hypothetical protein
VSIIRGRTHFGAKPNCLPARQIPGFVKKNWASRPALSLLGREANMTANRRWLLPVGAGVIVAIATTLVISVRNADAFAFLLALHPTVTTPDLRFSLSPDEQTISPARVRLFLFYQAPADVSNRLRAELTHSANWAAKAQEPDFQTYVDDLDGRAALFGTGLPRTLLSGPPEKTPSCYVVTVEAPPSILARMLKSLGF